MYVFSLEFIKCSLRSKPPSSPGPSTTKSPFREGLQLARISVRLSKLASRCVALRVRRAVFYIFLDFAKKRPCPGGKNGSPLTVFFSLCSSEPMTKKMSLKVWFGSWSVCAVYVLAPGLGGSGEASCFGEGRETIVAQTEPRTRTI